MKQFKILQIKSDSQATHGIKFSGLEDITKHGLRDKLTIDIYNQVYEGSIEDDDTMTILDKIFSKFQGVKPSNYTGHSVSVSDLIAMDGKYYFCDSFGWKEITLNKSNREIYNEIADILKKGNICGDIFTNNGTIEILIEWGDWKHDHGYLKYLMNKNGYQQIEENITEEDGSDAYSSVHIFKKIA